MWSAAIATDAAAALRDGQDPTLRGVPEIREVVDKSQVLEERIRTAYTRPAYRPLALCLIHGLSVLRLATAHCWTWLRTRSQAALVARAGSGAAGAIGY